MIEIKGLNKSYITPEGPFDALKDINLIIKDNEFVAILGESGSGKSTLLNMISGIDAYTTGEIIIDGVNTSAFNDEEFRMYRFKYIGFVFQRYNLIEHLTAKNNVVLPLMFRGETRRRYEEKGNQLLKDLGLRKYASTPVTNLSGGQKQRLAIARSMLTNPKILLCDEPTGSLDSESGEVVMDMIHECSRNRIVLLVTHDEAIAYKYATRIIRIDEGRIISDEINQPKPLVDKTIEIEKHEDIEVISHHKKTVKFIAQENFKQNRFSNYKIILSFVLGISLLLILNLFISNVMDYNKMLFTRNNDFKKYSVIDEENNEQLIKSLNKEWAISEAGIEHSYLIEDSYFLHKIGKFERLYTKTDLKSPNNVHQLVLKTLPKEEDNFYLNDYLLEKSKQNIPNGVYVTQELIYTHFIGKSFYNSENPLWYTKEGYYLKKSFFDQYPLESFLNSSINICSTLIYERCFETKIIGIIDTNQHNLNDSGAIFISQEGFLQFIDYLKEDLKTETVENLYTSNVYYYYKNFKNGNQNFERLENKYQIHIENKHLYEYERIHSLENIGNFVLFSLISTLFVIFAIVIVNMINYNLNHRIYDIGVYTSIGISVKTIQNIFVRESLKVIHKIILYLVIIYAIILFLFSRFYQLIFTNHGNLIKEFGRKNTMSFEVGTFILLILGIFLLYVGSVFYITHKASKRKAIEALSW